ncbi:MAG: hypothetical protein WD691_07420 [Acidimicrobiales bacterium]
MSRTRSTAVGGALLILTALAVAPSQAAPSANTPVHLTRAFTVLAEAYPTQSAPGSQDIEIKVRLASTKAVANNPPVGAFAQASAADLGLAEAYVGQQGPSAHADTATQGDDDVVVSEGGGRMEAHVDPTPKASSAARNSSTDGDPGSAGTVASSSVADGSAKRLVASARAEISDFRAGLFVLGSGRFEGTASIDGTPGGGRAAGFIRTSDATYAGIPITVGADGVQVDESKVPDLLLGPATEAIQEAFSPGGYADVRVVQPKVEIAADGTAAQVFGGGIFIYLTNNDPAERYFVSYTLLGGTATAELGGALAQPTRDRDSMDSPSMIAPTSRGNFSRPAPAVAPVGPDASGATQTELDLVMGSERVRLPGLWTGWVWALVLVGMAWTAAGALRLPPLAPTRARLARTVDNIADRYLRG